MADTPEFLIERLRIEREKTLTFFQEITPLQWERIIYTEGEQWSILKVLAHFVSTEKAIQKLVEDILSGGEGAPPDFDIDEFNALGVKERNGISPALLLSQFDQHRQRTIEIVQKLDDQSLQKQGRHPYLGIIPLVEIIKLVYRHNQIHQRDIRKSLSNP
jgi:hypothetical protein